MAMLETFDFSDMAFGKLFISGDSGFINIEVLTVPDDHSIIVSVDSN